MTFEYKMVQVPMNVMQPASKKARTGREAADYLEELANDMAADGWAFEGLEEMGIMIPQGCLGIGRPERQAFYVATFRRERE